MIIGLITQILLVLCRGILILVQFLLIVILGLLTFVVWILPWLLRIASIVSWIAGAYIAGQAVNGVYARYTDPLPLMALWAVPAILAAALPVWLFFAGQLNHIWGALFAFGLMCKILADGMLWLNENWQHADLFFRVAPVLLLAALVIYVSIRLRAHRDAQEQEIMQEGGDALIVPTQ